MEITRFVSPDYDIFMKEYDKNQLMTVCRENGFPHPITIDLSTNHISTINESLFPAILKPNLTTGGRGMKILSCRNDLEKVYEKNVNEFGPCYLQELVAPGGRQYKVELYLDEEWDYVITVCDHANETCPAFFGKVKHRLHLGFEDPSHAKGTPEFIDGEYIRIRDQIHETFLDFYQNNIEKEK